MGKRLSLPFRSLAFWLGLTYLLLIPAFATVYSSLPHGSFYDSNAHREEGANEDSKGVRDALSRTIRGHLEGLRWTVNGREVALLKKSVGVGNIEYTKAGHLLVEVHGVYKSVGPPLAGGGFSVWVEPFIRGPSSLAVAPNRTASFSLPVALSLQAGSAYEKPTASPLQPPVSLLFPPPPFSLSSSQPSPGGTLTMSEATYERLRRFYLAVDGDPSYASGLWLRMLYLSAVTITTLGFGDITPVSQAARSWVTCEAVLGVIVVGLFLSALAFHLRKRPN